MFNSLVCGAIKSIRFPKPPRHAGNGRRARAPAAADDGFPARFFFPGLHCQAEKYWLIGLGQQNN